MNNLSTGSSWNLEGTGLTGGELMLALTRLYEIFYGENPDLAKLNFLLFLAEGDAGIKSEILFADTSRGPKAPYVNNFIKENVQFIKSRTYGRAPKKSLGDVDVRKKVELTQEGRKIAEIAISSLGESDLRKLTRVIVKWGHEPHGELLTYICIFYKDFCTSVQRRDDGNSL